MTRAVIFGAGGIGSALATQLAKRDAASEIVLTWHRTEPVFNPPSVRCERIDICNEQQLARLADQIGNIDVLINAVGVLHTSEHGPEKALKQVEEDFFLHNMKVNALPSILIAKHFHRCFKHSRASVFATVSAKVGSIEDNGLGGWTSYRCSKAALNMALKNISIEWRRTLPNVCVAALHPGTTDTGLSKPFQKNVPDGKLFSTTQTADYLLDIAETLTPEKSGRFWSWNGEEIPW